MNRLAQSTVLAGTGVTCGHTILIFDADTPAACSLKEQLDATWRTFHCDDLREAHSIIRKEFHSLSIVLVNVTRNSAPWLDILRELIATSEKYCCGPKPFFLCVSYTPKTPLFQVQIEALGARFVHAS